MSSVNTDAGARAGEAAESPADGLSPAESPADGIGAAESRESAEEYLARALERAQRIARAKGYIRTALPAWGLEGTRPASGDLTGTSESAALDLGDDEGASGDGNATGDGPHRAPAPIEGDLEGDLVALERVRIRAAAKWAKAPGMAAMRLEYRPAGRLDSVLGRMIKKNHWDTPTKMGSIMAKWPQIVGPAVAEHSEVEAFEERTLIVRCSSTAWAKQLHLLLQTIERRIDEEVGAGVVERVIIRGPVAPSWRKGPLSVRGRGPRDTYG